MAAVAAAAARKCGIDAVAARVRSGVSSIRVLNAFVDETLLLPNVDGPLFGVPVAVKANICVEGLVASAASAMLQAHRPCYTATAVARLQAAGTMVAGSCNMDEFGMGSSTAYSFHGPSFNPYSSRFAHGQGTSGSDTKDWLTPGGSSGGSAVAVATGAVVAALGSDTGGSVRQPAAFCGIVGFKPSYGRISRHGLIAYASSLDTIGVLARSAGDAALLYDVVSGHDSADDTSVREPPRDLKAVSAVLEDAHAYATRSYALQRMVSPGVVRGALSGARWLDGDLRGLRVGCPMELRTSVIVPDIQRAWDAAVFALQSAGATVVDVSLPSLNNALPAYYIIAAAEAASNLSRYDGLRYGGSPAVAEIMESSATFREGVQRVRSMYLGQEVQRRIMIGNLSLSQSARHSYYEAALRVRESLVQDFNRVFGTAVQRVAGPPAEIPHTSAVDLLLSPVTPVLPWRSADVASIDPATLYQLDAMTVPASLAGLPALSLPFDLSPNGPGGARVPVAVQLIGRPLDDDTVLAVAATLERAVPIAAPSWLLPP
jgi:aspartyl-tRNA(Asn)/glutamyl-tRNA(Gln) amidotransferase subunit A